jgi:hypothetical protein
VGERLNAGVVEAAQQGQEFFLEQVASKDNVAGDAGWEEFESAGWSLVLRRIT